MFGFDSRPFEVEKPFVDLFAWDPVPGLFPKFFVLTFMLFIDWFWFWVDTEMLLGFHVEPVDVIRGRYFELPWNICSKDFDYCFWLKSSNSSPHPTLSSSL